MQRIASLSPSDRDRSFGASMKDYRAFYLKAEDVHLAVARETGKLLYMLARNARATNVVEFGTSFGLSTIYLAAAIADNGGGRLISTELSSKKAEAARTNVARAGLSDIVEIRDGDALDSLARAIPTPVDLVLLDGAKSLYDRVLTMLESSLRPGSMIVADNADMCPEYVQRVRSSGRYQSLAFDDDVELSVRL